MEQQANKMVKINGIHGKTIIVEPAIWKELNMIKVSEDKKSVNEVIRELLQEKRKVFKHQ